MPTHKRSTNGFDTNGLGAVATMKPDINSRLIHGIMVQVVGTGSPTFAEYVEYVEIEVNGKKDLLLKPTPQAVLDSILNANGDTSDTTMLYIPFTRPGQNWSPWGTKDIKNMSVRCKIVGANPGGKTLTKLQGFMVYSPLNTPRDRGDYVAQTVIRTAVPVAGWNTIDDLPVSDIASAIRMVLCADAVREVKVWVGDREAFGLPRDVAFEGLVKNPMYKLPAGLASFPVVLDDLGLANDYLPLIENGVKRPLKVEYYYDTTVTAVPVAFDIVLEGVVYAPVQAAA